MKHENYVCSSFRWTGGWDSGAGNLRQTLKKRGHDVFVVSLPPRSARPNSTGKVSTKYIERPTQNAIKEIYARCDVWLCGSWSEGFHLPPWEAMDCRCPVVSTRVDGSMDIIHDGVNGYLVPVGDFTALANQLVHVLSLPEAEWQAMSEAAYATATQYTWDDAVELFEAALHSALERRQLATSQG